MMIVFPRFTGGRFNPFKWRMCYVCGKRFGRHGAPLAENVIVADMLHDNTAAMERWSAGGPRPWVTPAPAPNLVNFFSDVNRAVRTRAMTQWPIVFSPDHDIFS
jgi:hypothetical protein